MEGFSVSEKESWSRKLPQGYQDILKSIDDFFQQTHDRLVDHPLFTPTIPIRFSRGTSELKIEAELPGVDRKQITIDVYNQGIHIKVQENEIIDVTNDHNQIRRRSETHRIRERFIPLGFHPTESEIHARYKNGLLIITVPLRSERIDIQ